MAGFFGHSEMRHFKITGVRKSCRAIGAFMVGGSPCRTRKAVRVSLAQGAA
jgi:hypothetical protein